MIEQMNKQIVFNKLIFETIKVLKVNNVLLMPLLIFLLLLIIILAPLGNIGIFVLAAILALKSVFLSGWLNMFNKSLKNYSQNENLSDEEKTLSSLALYKEFFPGVGQYFRKIFWGVTFYVLFINMFESVILHFFADFESFSLNDLQNSIQTQADFIAVWESISNTDKTAIFKLITLYVSFTLLFSYITMFWSQFVVVEGKKTFNAFKESYNTVLNDPINTFLIFAAASASFIFIFGLNIILGSNILSQLLFLILSSYATVFFIMMNFIYFERYRENIEKKADSENSN